MNQITDAERLKIVLEKLALNPHRLTLTLDYKSPSKIYNVLKGKEKMDIDFIEFFVMKYPQANFLYLMEGIGKPVLAISEAIAQKSMLGFSNNEENPAENINDHFNIIEKRLNIIESLLKKEN